MPLYGRHLTRDQREALMSFIDANKAHKSVVEICGALELHPRSYYRWKSGALANNHGGGGGRNKITPLEEKRVLALTIEFNVKTGCKIIWNPMDLRHSFAVNFLLENGDIKKLQYILGHQSIFDTRRLYAEVLNKKMKSNVFLAPEIGS